jgi:hypothetical protein
MLRCFAFAVRVMPDSDGRIVWNKPVEHKDAADTSSKQQRFSHWTGFEKAMNEHVKGGGIIFPDSSTSLPNNPRITSEEYRAHVYNPSEACASLFPFSAEFKSMYGHVEWGTTMRRKGAKLDYDERSEPEALMPDAAPPATKKLRASPPETLAAPAMLAVTSSPAAEGSSAMRQTPGVKKAQRPVNVKAAKKPSKQRRPVLESDSDDLGGWVDFEPGSQNK